MQGGGRRLDFQLYCKNPLSSVRSILSHNRLGGLCITFSLSKVHTCPQSKQIWDYLLSQIWDYNMRN